MHSSSGPVPSDYQEQDRYAREAIDRIRLGDRRAFDVLVKLYSGPIFELSRGMLGRGGEAEEAVQEIFLLVHRSLDHFNSESRFHPWLYTIAVNFLRSSLRQRGRRSLLKFFGYPEQQGADAYPSQLPGPEEPLLEREAEELLDRALMTVKASRREVFLLRRVRGLSVQETAQILGIPEGTVKTELFRAQKELVQAVTDLENIKPTSTLKPKPLAGVHGKERKK